MVRFIFMIFFLLLSLLCVFPAPAYYLWYVGILVSEFPWIFLLAVFILMASGFWVNKYRAIGSITGAVAFALFLSPVVRAYSIGKALDHNLEAAFGKGAAQPDGKDDPQPFHFWHMISGMNAAQLPYTTMSYSTSANGPLTLDYYRSAVPGKRPCVIVVHGGSWSAGDSRQLPELSTVLAKAGYNVATINYRMVPEYHSPAPVEDVQAALSYLRAHAADMDVDTTRFILLGRSAGGQIVLTAAYTLHDSAIKGAISYYGPADMVWGYKNPANPLVLNSCKIMEDYLGGTYEQVPKQYVASSATEMVSSHSVPTLLIHGKNDPLVAYEHSTRLEKKLEGYGIKHYLLTLPWATHGCDYTLNGPSGQLATYTVLRFLAQVCK